MSLVKVKVMDKLKFRPSSKLWQFILSVTWMDAENFMAIHPTVIKTFLSKLVKLLVGSPKSKRLILWCSWMFVQNFMAIHLIVEIFQSGPTHPSTHISIPKAMQLVRLKKGEKKDILLFTLIIVWWPVGNHGFRPSDHFVIFLADNLNFTPEFSFVTSCQQMCPCSPLEFT